MLLLETTTWDVGVDITTFICPHCLEDVYVYNGSCDNICSNCKGDIARVNMVLSTGSMGRFRYHKYGWFIMDTLSNQRRKELKNKI